jgi:hypothetical protein
MQGNSNFERIRKNSNQRPPRGEQREQQPQQKRGKQWSRENDKREQWSAFDAQSFNSFQ